MKKVLKIFGWLFVIMVFIIAVLFSLSKFYEKKIIAFAVSELNKNITVPISVDDIKFSVLTDFPNATINFENVQLAKSSDNSDTVFFVNELSIGTNILSILKKDYTISYINISNANISYSVYSSGKTNWDFIKAFTSNENNQEQKTSVSLNLNKIKFKNVRLNYSNSIKNQVVKLNFPSFLAKANIEGATYNVTTKGGLQLNQYKSGSFNFIPKYKTNLNLNMAISKDTVFFDNSTLNTKGLELSVSGNIILSSQTKLDLIVSATSLKLEDIIAMVPDKYSSKFKDSNIKGDATFRTVIKGVVTKTSSPYIKSSFTLDNGSLESDKYLNINYISLNGEYTNGSKRNSLSSTLSFKDLVLKSDSSYVKADFKISNFKRPVCDFDSELFIDSEKVKFINTDKFSISRGTVKGNLSASGYLREVTGKEVVKHLLTKSITDLYVTDLSFSVGTKGINVDNIDTRITHDNSIYKLQDLSCLFNGISVKTSSLQCKNLYQSIFTNSGAPLTISGNTDIGDVKYSELQAMFKSDKSKKNEFSEELYYRINTVTTCKSFAYNNLIFRNIKGIMNISNDIISGENLSFNAFQGGISTSFVYTTNPFEGNFDFHAVSRGIDITDLFSDFNNFGQDDLTNDNIKGKADTDVKGTFNVRKGKVDTKSIELLGVLTLKNGELIDYQPVQRLSSFTNISELSHIKFETMNTNFLVSNEVVNISNTDIRSNSMDLTIAGFQKFNGDYQYNIRVFLSDILRGKTKKIRQMQTEYGNIEDDGAGRASLFLVTKSENGKSSTKIDKIQLRKHLRGEVKEEKKEFKHTLHKEFGWFKKDTADFKKLKQKEEEKEKPKFEIEWDDE